MAGAEWYSQMAEAMKAREKCLNAITRWQENLAAAEDLIQKLRDSDVDDNPDDRLATAVADWKTQQESAPTAAAAAATAPDIEIQ